MVEEERENLPLSRACRLLAISRAGLYKARRVPPARDRALREAIEPIVTKWSGYGYRRVTHQLALQGIRANHKRVLRVMRAEGWLCRLRHARVRTTQSDHGLGVFPNRAGDLQVTAVDQLWVGDLTYIRLPEGFVYLATILDVYSRRVLGWHLAPYLDTRLTLAALEQALELRPAAHGVIFHSDQGVQYAAADYVERLDQAGFPQSMSRRGCPRDNAFAESFFATLKSEEVRLQDYQGLDDARTRISHFIDDLYNRQRLHSALGYLPPVVFEAAARTESPHNGAAAADSHHIDPKARHARAANAILLPHNGSCYQTPVPAQLPSTTVY